MPLTKISAFAIAGLISIGAMASVIGQDIPDFMMNDTFVAPATPEEAHEAREALMKDNGATMGAAKSATGADAVAAMQHLYANFSHIPALFPEGSIVGDSHALPAIWEKWDAFVAITETGKAAALAGIAAAEAGDAAAYQTAFATLGGQCGACHGEFRGK